MWADCTLVTHISHNNTWDQVMDLSLFFVFTFSVLKCSLWYKIWHPGSHMKYITKGQTTLCINLLTSLAHKSSWALNQQNLLSTSEILDSNEKGYIAKSLGEKFPSNHIPSFLVKLRLWVQFF